MNKSLVKQDISCFEYPLWFQDERLAEQRTEGFLWQDREGYIYRAGYKPPVKIDRLFLLYLVLKSQNEGWSEQIELTRFEILKACLIQPNSYWYKRLEDSLTRWKMLGVEFHGTFYDGNDYRSISFGIIDSWKIEAGSKKLKIRFSPEWLLQQKNSRFYEKIDFHEVRELRSSLTMRLYEILLKTFHGRSKWEIDSFKLAQKIPMKEIHPSHIVPKIKTAVKQINKQTSLRISLEVRRPQRGKAIFTFRKQEKVTVKELREEVSGETREKLEELLGVVPEKERKKKSLEKMIVENLEIHGYSYVLRNIIHTNRNAKKSYSGYLWKSFKEDYGEALELEENEEMTEVEQEEELLVLPTLSEVLGVPEEHKWQFEDLVHLVLEDYRDSTSVFEIIELGLQKRTIEEVIWSILYANQYHTSYLPSLHSSIQVNQGQFYRILLARKKMDSKSSSKRS